MNMVDTIKRLETENAGLRAEVARLTTMYVKRAPARDDLARKAYNACAALKEWPVNTKAPNDIRRGFWYAASRAGISIAIIARVSHAHHRVVSRFVSWSASSPEGNTTLVFRKARDAAREVFKEAAKS
jgi:hypothetical protein